MTVHLFPPVLMQTVPFGDPDAWLDFNGHHALWHQALAQATATPFVTLDDLKRDLLRHADLHTAVAKAAGIASAYDLVSYDLSDRDSFAGFMQTHALDHDRLRKALGI